MLAALSTRRPLFWVSFFIFSFIAGIASWYYFSKAFSILNVNITMNREEALQKARCLANLHGWGPIDYEQTTVFSSDEDAKDFIELEGGGKEKLNEIIEKKVYAIYRWTVRHFKEYDAHETYAVFTPEGNPYGFQERFAEDAPGKALSKDEAQKIAEEAAQKDWSIPLKKYTLVERSSETKPNGRIDHTFIYELKEKIIKNGPLRLRLGVTGDIFSHLEHSVRIPDAFTRRYQEMRSFNAILAYVALLFVIILYLFGGCLLGLFWMIKSKNVIWRQAFLCSGVLSILAVLSTISSFPTIWITYDTALAKTTIFTKFLLEVLLTAAVTLIGFGVIFAVAETLSRKAFGNHPLLWKIWNKNNASSIQILGRTALGYLFVTFDLCLCVLFYYFMGKYFGWWSPSSTLIDPNILANYMPWVSAISRSINAGFMEECLFRAIPLSGAFLLGKWLGKPYILLTIGLFAQAFIFGAAHANYPAQPFYARLIELILPSLGFGGIFIFYGLLPVIISHVIYDLIWFSLPIFLSSASGIWLQQVLVLFFGIVPFIIIIIDRLRTGSWHKLTSQAYNRAWKKPDQLPRTISVHTIEFNIYKPHILYFGLLAFSCLALWSVTTSFKQDGLPITITEDKAREISDQIWKTYKVTFNKPWRKFSIVQSSVDVQKSFIWQTQKNLYPKLLSTYISPTQWYIRYAQFEGNIIDRAEEFWSILNPDGNLASRKHILPEAWKGAKLSENQARQKVYTILIDELHIDLKNLKEISATSEKLPNRIDWVFIFKDIKTWLSASAQEGQARIKVALSGDQFAGYEKYIFVPESWERSYRHQQTLLQILESLCSCFVNLLLLIGLAFVVKQWLNHQFNIKLFFVIFIAFLTKSTIQLINLYDLLAFTFKTSQPYFNQEFTTVTYILLQSIVQGAIYTLLIVGSIGMHFRTQRIYQWFVRGIIGTSFGVMLSAITNFIRYLVPSNQPLIPEVIYAAAHFPIIGQALAWITNFITITLTIFLSFYVLELITKRWSTFWFTFVCAWLLGLITVGNQGITQLSYWICAGSIIGLAYFFLYHAYIRFDRALIPYISGSYFIMSLLQQSTFNAWPGAITSAFLAILCICGISLAWSNILIEKQ